MPENYCAHDDFTSLITHHYRCNKSNNVHQSYATMDMSEESSSLSKPVLEIPSSLAKERQKNNEKRNGFRVKNIFLLFSIFSYLLKIVPIFADSFLKKRKKKRRNILDIILKHSLMCHITILLVLSYINVSFVECAVGGAKVKHRDEATVLELCKNFTQGNPERMEFASPQYNPSQDDKFYPQDITCFRTITADYGYFVRIDFRDVFNVEPPSNEGECAYDYLEIRDGDQGYSPLIGKFCGNQFPRIITSKGRSLWLRFKSDSTIQYKGFKIVYKFIPDPQGTALDLGKCTFEVGGHMGYIGTANISENRIAQSLAKDSNSPIDCIWTITVAENYQVYIKFEEPKLAFPNDCHLNYVQVFDGDFREQLLLDSKTEQFTTGYCQAKYCGTVFDNINSINNIVYVRFYAEKQAIQDSTFEATFTAMRNKEKETEPCEKNEYDCEDATCISPELVCNDVRNCKFGWDEESCGDKEGGVSLDFSSPTVFMILIVLILILMGMCAGMLLSFRRTLKEDEEEDEEEGEDNDGVDGGHSGADSPSLAVISNSNHKIGESTPRLPTSLPPSLHSKRPLPPHAHHDIYPSNDDSNAGNGGASGGCYVPDGGFSLNARF